MTDLLAAAVRTDPALAAVVAFTRRHGPRTTVLAMHAALPLGLSPELVHLLRVNFVREAPFIAEADLLLSPLCTEVGGGMYEMDADVRELLLVELAASPAYGPAHVRRVARFLHVWAARALDETADADAQEHLRVQQWVALAYEDPALAAEELAGALRAGVEAADRPEVARVARLTTVLSAPLAAQVELRRYAGAVERIAATGAPPGAGSGDVRVGRERLPALEGVVRLWQPQDTSSGQGIQEQSTAAAEPPIEQQANVTREPPVQEQVDAPEATSVPPDSRYRVARVVVLGDAGVGKTTLISRVSAGVYRPAEYIGEALTRWMAREGTSGEGGLDVVFGESRDGTLLGADLLDAAAVLVLVGGPGSAQSAERWLDAARTGTLDRPVLLVQTDMPGEGWRSSRSHLEPLVHRHAVTGIFAVDAKTGSGVADLQRALVEAIDWRRQPSAESREQVDRLERWLLSHLRDSLAGRYDERLRRDLAAGLHSMQKDAEAALDQAMQCVVARDVLRIVGEPPWAVVRADAYRRCLAEVWQAAAAVEHDRPGLPSVPMRWLERRFSAPEVRGYLGADPTPGVLDLVLEDLARRRWGYLVDTPRGRQVVIPFLYRSRDGLPEDQQPRGQQLIRARWPGRPNDIFVLLLVYLADVGDVEPGPLMSATLIRGDDVFQLHASAEGDTAQVTLSMLRGGGEVEGLRHMIHDRVAGSLQEGVQAEFTYPEAAPSRGEALQPPAGVDLAQACLVVLPQGTGQVGERVVDFDALWEHLYRPAVADTWLPEGSSLAPVRIPRPADTPLPDWTRAARLVVFDISTAASLKAVPEQVLNQWHGGRRALLFAEAGSTLEPLTPPVHKYQFGSPEELARQRGRVSDRLASALRTAGEDAEDEDNEAEGTEPVVVSMFSPGLVHAGDHLTVTVALYPQGARPDREEFLEGNQETSSSRLGPLAPGTAIHLRLTESWGGVEQQGRLSSAANWMATEFRLAIPPQAAGKGSIRLKAGVAGPRDGAPAGFTEILRRDVDLVPAIGGTESHAAQEGAGLKIDRQKFLAAYEEAFGLLGGRGQREGLEKLLSAAGRDPQVTDPRWLAYMLATVKHETAGRWVPVEEDGKGKGRPYGEPVTVTDPVGRKYTHVYFGRGYVQLTWEDNYRSMGEKLDNRLLYEPQLALDPEVAYKIMSLVMRQGAFTGVGLSKYISGDQCDYVNARRIINGTDQAEKIAGYAIRLESILRASIAAAPNAPPVQQQQTAPAPIGGRFTVMADTLSVRSGPDRSNPALGTVPRGTVLTPVAEQDGWRQITSPVAGWVNAQYLQPLGAQFIVTAVTVNVRGGPGTLNPPIGTLRRGAVVTAVAEQEGWKQITAPMTGWISAQFLQEIAGKPVTDRLTVVISGTGAELSAYRAHVIDACQRADAVPYMVEAGAQLADPVREVREVMDRADVYVGVFGHRYGPVPDGYDISLGQMEFEQAVEREIPRLVYLLHDDVPVPAGEIERENRAKLDTFQERLRKEQVVTFFRNPDELRAMIIRDLAGVRVRLEAQHD